MMTQYLCKLRQEDLETLSCSLDQWLSNLREHRNQPESRLKVQITNPLLQRFGFNVSRILWFCKHIDYFQMQITSDLILSYTVVEYKLHDHRYCVIIWSSQKLTRDQDSNQQLLWDIQITPIQTRRGNAIWGRDRS